MKKRICALIAVVLMFASVGQVLAKDGRYVREEAARRDMKLLTIEQAKDIAAKRLGSANVRFKDFDLDNEADDYPNGSDFRPVYEFECLSGGREYDFEIDAVTGEVLKFKLDD